jgi:hypothetical protein
MAELNLTRGKLGQERTTPTLANQLVDVGHQVDWKNDVRSSAQSLRHTYSVTYMCHCRVRTPAETLTILITN